MIERIGGVDRAEPRDRPGRRQHSRNIRDRHGGCRPHVATSQEFAGTDEGGREDEAERDAYARPEEATFNRIADEQDRTERKRQAADPDGPPRSDPFFEAAAGSRTLCVDCGWLGCAGDSLRHLVAFVRCQSRDGWRGRRFVCVHRGLGI
jgi:hypothetical protein